MNDTLLKIFLLPLIPIVFAYFELGGNWFAYRLVQSGVSVWSVFGTIIFSVLYSLIAAIVSIKTKMDLGLLMVAYGFGFSIVAIFLRLEWGKIPSFSSKLLEAHSLLWVVAFVALGGFLISSYLVVTSKTLV